MTIIFQALTAIPPEQLLLFSLLLVQLISVLLSELRSLRVVDELSKATSIFNKTALSDKLRKNLTARVGDQIYEVQKDLLLKLAQIEVKTGDRTILQPSLDEIIIKMERLEDAVSQAADDVVREYFSDDSLEERVSLN